MGDGNNNNKREKIIRAAQEIMAEKGLKESTIAEIAKRGGVFDSEIYRHFKNKEDLLFSSLSEKVKETADGLTFHLNGIMGATAKLSKFIWFHLHINDFSSSSTRMVKHLLFECRSNARFYQHESYQDLRKYTSILKPILKEGVESHAFRNDFSLHLVRDMIFGFIDEEAISCLLIDEIQETLNDFPAIMSLVLAMIQSDPGDSPTRDNPDKSARILEAATKVFAAKGYDKATAAEIATEAQVAEGTVYEYFKNKEELLFSISEREFKTHKDNLERMFELRDPLRKLECLIYHYSMVILSNPKFALVFLKDTKLNKKFYSTKSYSNFVQYMSILNQILDEGKEKGVFRADVNNRVFRNLFTGTFAHLPIRWFVVGKVTPIAMMEELHEITALLCRSVTRKINFPVL